MYMYIEVVYTKLNWECAQAVYAIPIICIALAGFIHTRELNRHSGSVVERPLCDREVAGSIPSRVIPKTLKMVLAAHAWRSALRK